MVIQALAGWLAAAVLASTTSALDEKLYGLNYDLRQGADWDPEKCKTEDAIAADLKALSALTSNLRIYSLSDCDVTAVLTSAKELDMTVWLGVWLSDDQDVFDAEVTAFEKLIGAGLIDDNIVGINVGSEAVYRGDITAEEAIKYASDFREVMAYNDIVLPVGIADIIDTFVEFPDMLKAGTVVTVNQFPFWERIEVEDGAARFNSRIKPLLELAGDMEVIITETGWASGGSSESAGIASPENAARYLNDFYVLAEEKGWKYYYFAGLDTPYKAEQADDETTVESHFGILKEDRTMKAEFESLSFAKLSSFSASGSFAYVGDDDVSPASSTSGASGSSDSSASRLASANLLSLLVASIGVVCSLLSIL